MQRLLQGRGRCPPGVGGWEDSCLCWGTMWLAGALSAAWFTLGLLWLLILACPSPRSVHSSKFLVSNPRLCAGLLASSCWAFRKVLMAAGAGGV